MNNSSLSEDFPLPLHELHDLWRTINSSPTDPVAHWIWIASYTFAWLGSISNLMCVVVLIRLSTQLSTFIYLTALSLSDMITCLSIIVTHSVEFLVQSSNNTKITFFLRYVDIVFGGVAAGSRVLSLWISTAVTMDRWILICYPIYGKNFCTLNRARIVSRTLFMIAFLYSVPLFFEYEIIKMPNISQMITDIDNSSSKVDRNSVLFTKGYSDLAKRRLYRWAYMFFNAIFVYSLPTLMIVFFNLQLIRALHRLKSRKKHLRQKHQANIPSNNLGSAPSQRSQQSKYSVTIMVIAMVLTLLLCRSPTIVLWVLWSFELTIKIFFDSATSSMVRRFHTIANLIAIINAATNFLPFCVFGQLFRAECLTIYCCRKTLQEQFAQQGRRKLDENQQSMSKIQRQPRAIQVETPLTIFNENVKSTNSETASGVISTYNHKPIVNKTMNAVLSSDSPINHLDYSNPRSKFPVPTTPLLDGAARLES